MSDTLKQIRAAGYAKLLGAALIALAQSVLANMTGNTAYLTIPVNLSVLKAAIDAYIAAIAAALDGGKKALQERDAARVALIKTLRALEQYVELNCKDDMTIFMSSGFQPLSITRSAPQPLPPASIVRIDAGPNSGQMQPVIKSLPKARSYTVQYAVAQVGTSPMTWTAVTFTAARKAPMITGLTPGASYTFQVRALGSLGSTDWSDPVTRICL